MSAKSKKDNRRDSMSFVNPDGTESNSDLHEQIMAGVDDSQSRKVTAICSIVDGLMTKSMAERAFGVTINDDELPARTPEFIKRTIKRRKSIIKQVIAQIIAQGLPQRMIDRLIDEDDDISHAELVAIQKQVQSDIDRNGYPTEEELLQEIQKLNRQ